MQARRGVIALKVSGPKEPFASSNEFEVEVVAGIGEARSVTRELKGNIWTRII